MDDGKSSCLLRKSQGKLPNQNNCCVYEDGKCSVLVFAGQIAANPGVGTKQRPMTLTPTSSDIGKHGEDRKLVIVVPEDQRIMPEQEEAECENDETGSDSADDRGTNESPLHRAVLSTSNFQRPTFNAQCDFELGVGRCALSVERFPHSYRTTGFPSVKTRTLSSIPWARAAINNRFRGSSTGS